METSSAEYRSLGTKLLQDVLNAKQSKMCNSIISGRAQKAIYCYDMAFESGMNEVEKSSAAKNLGISFSLKAAHEISDEEKRLALIAALKNYFLALGIGSNRDNEWKNGTTLKLEETMKQCEEYSATIIDNKRRISFQHDIESCIPENYFFIMKVNKIFENFELFFNLSVRLLENKSHIESLAVLNSHCYPTLERAKKYINAQSSGVSPLIYQYWERKVIECSGNLNFHLAWGEATVQLNKADALLFSILNEMVGLNYELEEVWNAIDLFKGASVLSRGIVIEIEAEVLAKMGKVFHKIIKDSKRATAYLKQSFYLVESLKPKSFIGVSWFEELKTCMIEIQKEIPEDNEDELDEEMLMKHEDLLFNMKKQKNSFDFLRHIYATFLLPWEEKRKLPELTSSNIKKLLLIACTHYHPDKFVNESFEGYSQNDSKFISSEITKILTSFYAKFKSEI